MRFLCGVLLLVASLAGAQTVARQEPLSTGGLVSTLRAEPVLNEPYTAVQSAELVRVLPDGTRVVRHGHHFVARDSAGRVRVEQRLGKTSDGSGEIKMVYIKDPVAHTVTTWMEGLPNARTATITNLSSTNRTAAAAACTSCQQRESSRPQPVVTTTDLGSSLLDGVAVTGKLTTTTVPAGRSGNDHPITKTHEVWTSDEMKLVLKQKFDDPRFGKRTIQLVDFSRAEPPAALFRPPAGYQVQSGREALEKLIEKLQAAEQAQ